MLIAFWYFSDEEDTDIFFYEGIGRVFYMWLPGQRRALRISSAETWLTFHRSRLLLIGSRKVWASGDITVSRTSEAKFRNDEK